MIKIITDNELKSKITNEVLRDLPEWFGIEESLVEYVNNVVKYPFIAIYEGDEVAGFYSLREENKYTLDMYVLGIKKKFHGKGLGTQLQEWANKFAMEQGYKQMIVLTLSNKSTDKNYAMTRKFYYKMGFIDLYESDKIWDEYNPTLIMVKMVA